MNHLFALQQSTTFLLLLFCICLRFGTPAIPTVPYSYPTIQLDNNSTILVSSSYGTISTLRVTDSYIFRKSPTGSLIIWDLQTQQLLYELFNGTTNFPTQICVAFDFSNENSLVAVLTSNKNVLVVGIDLSGFSNLISNFSLAFNQVLDLKIAGSEIVILQTAINGVSAIHRYYFNGTQASTAYNSLIIGNPIYRIKTCQPATDPTLYYTVAWKDDCYFEVFECPYAGDCNSIHSYSSWYCTSLDWTITTPSTLEVGFSQECSLLFFQQKTIGTRLIDIKKQMFLADYPIRSGEVISETVFMDMFDLFFATISQSGNYVVNQYSPSVSSTIFEFAMPVYGPYSEYNFFNKKFITADDGAIYTYTQICTNSLMILSPEGFCLECPLNCLQCDINGICLFCEANQTLTNNTCQSQLSNNITTNNTTTNNISTNNITNNANDTVTNLTANQNESSSFRDSVTVQPIYWYEESIGNIIGSQRTKSIIQISMISVTFLQIFPFSFLFIKFINFWTICSLYLLLGVRLPKYFYELINFIYQQMTASLFENLGISFKDYFPDDQKVMGPFHDLYGISSNFMPSNMENFCMLIFSYLILAVLYVLKRKYEGKNFIGNLLSKINFPIAILGQYVGIMNSFFLNIPTIQSKSYHTNFYQKINLSLHVAFIAISLPTIGIAFALIQSSSSHDEQQDDPQQSQKKFKREWSASFLCNSLIPSFAILGNRGAFFLFSAFLFLFQVFSAFKATQFRTNSIIRSLYLTTFHLNYIILTMFDQQKYPQIYHNTGVVLIIILFLGAVHQLLTFIFGLIYDIYFYVKKYLSKVTDDQNQEKNIINDAIDKCSVQQSQKKKLFIPQIIKKQEISESVQNIIFTPKTPHILQVKYHHALNYSHLQFKQITRSKYEPFKSIQNVDFSKFQKRKTNLTKAIENKKQKIKLIQIESKVIDKPGTQC